MKKTKLITSVVALTVAASSYAGVVLQIDISNPSSVTITALNQNSLVNTTASFGDFTLQNFLTSSANMSTPINLAGDLGATSSANDYTNAVTINFGTATPTTGDDVNIFGNPASATFSTTASAFSGASTINWSTFSAALPSSGATGPVNAGTGGAQIGEWTVVPEPGTFAFLLGAAGLGFVLIRRRLRK